MRTRSWFCNRGNPMHPMHPNQRQKGFTLIELLLVLAIVAIMLGIASYYGLPKQPAAVRGATFELAASVRDAQSLAKNSGQNVYFRTSGSGPSFLFEYGVFPLLGDGTEDKTSAANFQPRGSFAPHGTNYLYAQVDSGGAMMDTAAPTPNLRTQALFVPGGTGSYLVPQADPTLASAFFFLPSGQASANFYLDVVGLRGGQPYTKSPLGLISVSTTTGLRAFYKGEASSGKWQRM